MRHGASNNDGGVVRHGSDAAVTPPPEFVLSQVVVGARREAGSVVPRFAAMG